MIAWFLIIPTAALATITGDMTGLKAMAMSGGTYQLTGDIFSDEVYVAGGHSAGLVVENDLTIDLNGHKLEIDLPDANPGGRNSNGINERASRIIVVGDADFPGTLMEASQGEMRNLDFLLRAAEWLYGNDELLAIRGRETRGRLDRIMDPEIREAFMTFSSMLNTIFIPLAVIITGIFIVRKRKKTG